MNISISGVAVWLMVESLLSMLYVLSQPWLGGTVGQATLGAAVVFLGLFGFIVACFAFARRPHANVTPS